VGKGKQLMNMNDYVDVAQRIAQLKEVFPEASLQPYDPNKPYDIVEVAGKTYVVYTAACYRDPHDIRPGVACAWEQIPGKGMTAGSELMVCETSAWGRAIVAAMKTATKRIASKQEVLAAKERSSTWSVAPSPALEQEFVTDVAKDQQSIKRIYGSPGSKSALMERVLRKQFEIDATNKVEEKAEPSSVAMSMDAVVNELGSSEPTAQQCQHGQMILKQGLAKGTQRPFYGYTCPKGCQAVWATLSSAGKWYFKEGANKNG
jgi:hypothetical protein